MASAATGFMRGFQGSLADARQRKMQDEDRADRKESLAYSRNRQQKLDARSDLTFEQSQQDREASLANAKQLSEQERARIAKQAQDEGMGNVMDAIDAGADPNQAMNLYNQNGQHKLKSLTYDPTTKMLTMVGDGGGEFTGTTAQIRAALGLKTSAEKPVVVPEKSRLATPGGKVLLDAAPGETKYEQTDPTKDTWEIGPDGKRRLVSKGVPKASGADGEGATGPGGRKISPFNPESYAKEAADVVGKYYQGVYDPKTGMFSFDPGARDKATYAIGLAGQLARHFNGKISAQEAGQYAAEVSADIPTEDEAQAQAAREKGKNATPDQIKVRATQIQRDARVLAAQKLDEYMDQMDELIQAQEAEQASKQGNTGTRPPLDSFNK